MESVMKASFILLALSSVNSTISIPRPVIPTAVPTLNVANLSVASVGEFSSDVSNALCEQNPTHILCGTSVATGHKILQNLPAETTLRHCSVFAASPHCCAQFCPPAPPGKKGGYCDTSTSDTGASGACVCESPGVPNVCQLLMKSDTSSTAGMSQNDLHLLDMCRRTCERNTLPGACKKAAAATDGIVGTVCFCYCEPE